MSVIGRLDEQVDEVLIKPLAKTNRPETDEQKDDENSASRAATPEDAEPTPARERLPVWLL